MKYKLHEISTEAKKKGKKNKPYIENQGYELLRKNYAHTHHTQIPIQTNNCIYFFMLKTVNNTLAVYLDILRFSVIDFCFYSISSSQPMNCIFNR